MLRAICFIKEKKNAPGGEPGIRGADLSAAWSPEAARAVLYFREAGFRSGILYMEGPEEFLYSESPGEILHMESPGEGNAAAFRAEELLLLCDSGPLARALRRKGRYVAGYSHMGNPGEDFSGIPYIVAEPDLVDPDSYRKMYEREAGIPWTILQTRRTLVREFAEGDLDGICALYDRKARRFLEPPSDDHAHELAVLRAYIDRIYGLYGFGHWAVLAGRDTLPVPEGTLIGRMGFSAVTAQQEKKAALLGVQGIDADFGFLLRADCRGIGVAEEVCRALLCYGFTEIGFSRVRADARVDNEDSIRLLGKLGFVPAGTSEGKMVFFCTEHNMQEESLSGR